MIILLIRRNSNLWHFLLSVPTCGWSHATPEWIYTVVSIRGLSKGECGQLDGSILEFHPPIHPLAAGWVEWPAAKVSFVSKGQGGGVMTVITRRWSEHNVADVACNTCATFRQKMIYKRGSSLIIAVKRKRKSPQLSGESILLKFWSP